MDYLNIDKIIEYYQDENELDDCDMTIDDNIKRIMNLVIDEYVEFNSLDNEHDIDEHEMELLINEFDSHYIHYLSHYLDDVNKIIKRIDGVILPEQRTTGWYLARSKLISASDSGYVMRKLNNKMTITSNYERTLLQKIGIKWGYFSSPPLIHGTIFEIVTQEAYELRNGVKISEYGCLPHYKESFIGASPDGIVTKVDNPKSLNQITKLGRMLEIKNPYSRIVDNTIKFEYKIQIQVQLQVTGLEICDFVETKIKHDYKTVDDFYNDVFEIEKMDMPKDSVDYREIQNHNIPVCNLDKNGMEKGFLIHFHKSHSDRDENLGILYPMTIPYNKENINEWKNKTIDEYEQKGYRFERHFYFKIEIYSLKTVKRDDKWWNEEIYPALRCFWDDVLEARKKTDKQITTEYKNIYADPDGTELKNPETGEIIKRKLKYESARSREKRARNVYTFSETSGTIYANDSRKYADDDDIINPDYSYGKLNSNEITCYEFSF